MVRHVTVRTSPGAAGLAILVAAGVILCHVLACTESPMAFSPDGRNLAFVTLEPYGGTDVAVAGIRACRLMVLADRKDLRILEQSTDALLGGPAYSPDGRQLCYLRIGLLTRKDLEQVRNAAAERMEKWEQVMMPPEEQPAQDEDADPEDPGFQDLTLPDTGRAQELARNALIRSPMAAALIIRDARSGEIRARLPLEMQGMDFEDESLYLAYIMAKPQYSPDGQWIYICVGGTVTAVHPERHIQRLLATQATVAELSPDGHTLAVLQQAARDADKSVLAFVRTDGSRATYVRWEGQPISPSGLAWVGNETLAALTFNAQNDGKAELHLVRTDGAAMGGRRVVLPQLSQNNEGGNSGELAIAPDGKHMIAAYGHTVFFMDGAGKVIQTWNAPETPPDKKAEGFLAQPTFSPDGKLVAFKRMIETEFARAQAIAFFTPEGKELARVEIPNLPPGTTRPIRPEEPEEEEEKG